MKKILLLIMFVIALPVQMIAQSEFPYSKILQMSSDELKGAKFKYDADKNQYVLRKSNGLLGTANVLNALNGTSADVRPHVDDYQITVQYGDDGVSSLHVIFYNDNTYHELLTFALDNGENILKTDSNTKRKTQFNYNGLAFELNMEIKGRTAITEQTNSALAKAVDESFNVYVYTVFTGLEPNSEFIRREAKKQEKRDEKGKKKRAAADLMY